MAQSPFKGFNRCSKSCRLRWLNYLKPDIKRGEFTLDEIDLMFRLHNLLGNRWSLIAGRLPGRTENDVKNFWNTHMRKELKPSNPHCEEDDEKGKTVKIIKPRPCKISKDISLFTATAKDKDHRQNDNGESAPTFFEGESTGKENEWWSKFSFDEETRNSKFSFDEETWNFFFNEEQE
ncbi:hypothetical protein JCGZ_11819 [Jatropha curcas]|uniref:MYB family protein n=1 Tax=Jatropha curcas TaxID=180498 RepID=A0A067K8U1_JATCU|nr:hypothetical protein JCGZ_11819 [Jatropha curcas]